jgi:Rod binding domain-containing protein
MDALSTDASLALQGADQQDLVRRKLEMDALRRRLGDTRTEGEKLREACEGFESIFIQKLWEQMRKTVPKEGYLHSKDEETYQSLFDVELAKKMSSAGGIGLADMLYEQLSRQLERTARATTSGAYRKPLPLAPVDPAAQGPAPGRVSGEDAALTEKNLYSPLEDGEQQEQETGEETLARALDEMRADLERLVPPSEKGAAIRAEIAAGLSPAGETPARPGDEAEKISAAPERGSGFGNTSWQGNGLISAKPRPASSLGRRDGRAVQEADTAPETGPAQQQRRGQPPQETLWPYDGRVVSRFGWTEDAGGGRSWNAGVTLEGNAGESVRAILDGTVVFSGPRENYGNTLILEHKDGFLSYYGNVETDGLKVGDVVGRGMEFARIQAQASPSGKEEISAPLFFALKRGEMALNPETAIKKLTVADRE